jgi:putative oxidoreductase
MSIHPLLSWSLLVIRLTLGIIFIAHGGQKLFGIWGGPCCASTTGLAVTIQTFEKNMGIPSFLTVLSAAAESAAAEFLCGIGVVVGLLTRFAAATLGVIMVVAMIEAHLPHGFFINWQLARGVGHGIEFNVALLGMSLGLLLSGPGKLSLDRLLGIEKE